MDNQPNPQESLAVLKSLLGGKVVSYHSVFARALRSVPAAVILSQAFFWQENANFKELKEIDGVLYFTKTAAEWYEATGVTAEAQPTARELLRQSGILLEKRTGLPAKLYYHIDINSLVSVIYRYLNSGEQVSVDNRSQKRELTRASNGNFRQPVSVNYRSTYMKESLESKEESITESNSNVTDDQKNFSDSTSKKGKEEKAPRVAAAPPKVSQLFAHSEWANVDAIAWRDALQSRCTDLPADLDTAYYHRRCLEWSATGKTSKNWLATAATFARQDFNRQTLATIQTAQTSTTYVHSHAATRNNTVTPAIQRFAEVSQRIGDRYRARHAATGN